MSRGADALLTALACLLVFALICGGEWGCARVFCAEPVWGGAKIGWTCLGGGG